MLEQGIAGSVDDANRSRLFDFEGLVVGPVFFRLLRHQPDVADVTHGRHVISAMLLAVRNDFLVDPRVAAVRDHRARILELAIRSPHLPRGSNRRRHRGIDNDVARHVKIRNALVRIDHREGRAGLVLSLDVGFDLCSLCVWEVGDPRIDVTNPVVRLDTQLGEQPGMLFKHVAVVNRNRVAEHDRVGDFHHRRLEVQRQQHIVVPCRFDFPGEVPAQRITVHHGGIDDLAGLDRIALF